MNVKRARRMLFGDGRSIFGLPSAGKFSKEKDDEERKSGLSGRKRCTEPSDSHLAALSSIALSSARGRRRQTSNLWARALAVHCGRGHKALRLPAAAA